MRIKQRKLPKLDDLFERDDQYLQRPDTGAGRPALVAGRRRSDGALVLVKSWQKAGSAIDADLQDLWRRETRHSERLRARPGADDLLVPIIEASEAQDAFYAVMPGEWTPLSAKLRHCGPQNWLRGLQSEQHRQVFWQNMRRLVEGLDLIHGQRVVYGGLNEDVIFTASDHEADFRIGGFEWCCHIEDTTGGPQRAFASSPADDFASIGGLAASLLAGVDSGDVTDRASRIAALDLSPTERALLRTLMNPVEHGHFDRRRLGELLAAVEKDFVVSGWGERGRFVLGVQLDGSRLPEIIGEASDWQIKEDDRKGQVSFIAADLAAGAEIVRHAKGEIWGLGQSLAYSLTPGGPAGAKWKAANVRYAKPRDRLPFNRAEPRPLPSGAADVITQAEVAARLRSLGDLARDWTAVFEDEDESGESGADVRLGMLLTDVVLTVSSAVEAIPVEIIKRAADHILLCAVEDDEFEELRAALRLKDPARRLQGIFELEEGDRDGSWTLRSSAATGAREIDSMTVTFDKVEVTDGQRYYRFRTGGRAPADDFLYLSKYVDRNPHSVVQRRARLLAALGSQKELVRTLDRPESTLSEAGRQPLAEDEAFHELDRSKQSALRTIWRKTPLQAVVGPPGVGKTHLLADYVRRSLEEDSSRRILVAAQGHQALDNAGQALSGIIDRVSDDDEVLVVRSKSDRSHASKELYASVQVRGLLERVRGSALAKRVPGEQRKAIEELLALSKSTSASVDGDRARELRSMESTVMQSATVLLSTTNSSELSRLVESGAVFDEVIIEEAAKATGPELLAPMLLSMQRLLIGDHKQLPAFDSERLLDLLTDPASVATVLKNSETLAGSLFRDHGLEELLEASADENRLARLCAKARGLVRLFETLVVRDEERKTRFPGSARLAVELTEQRRMHPVICEVVSQVFYAGNLSTSDAARAKFEEEPFPVRHLSGHIPNAPIVWVDLPYVQVKSGAEEATPTFHNPAERSAVLAVLEQMRPADDNRPPSLAILSPYLRQAERLGNEITDRMGALEHLAGFKAAATSGAWAGTVDAFQGSEADVVMVSLVRNNGEFGRPALGFVSDPRRMGVLLSRARRQLILVGSYEFFRAQARRFTGPRKDRTGAGCIADLMEALHQLHQDEASPASSNFVVVPASALTGGSS